MQRASVSSACVLGFSPNCGLNAASSSSEGATNTKANMTILGRPCQASCEFMQLQLKLAPVGNNNMSHKLCL